MFQSCHFSNFVLVTVLNKKMISPSNGGDDNGGVSAPPSRKGNSNDEGNGGITGPQCGKGYSTAEALLACKAFIATSKDP